MPFGVLKGTKLVKLSWLQSFTTTVFIASMVHADVGNRNLLVFMGKMLGVTINTNFAEIRSY